MKFLSFRFNSVRAEAEKQISSSVHSISKTIWGTRHTIKNLEDFKFSL